MTLFPDDDWLHQPEAATGWQENWLFAGLDPNGQQGSGTGFYVHLGRLTEFDRYDVKVAVAVGGEVVSTSLSRRLEDPAKDDLAAPGLEVTAVEPFQTWRLRYDGTGRAGLADGLLCTDASGDDALHFDLTFEALGPPLDMAEGMRLLADQGNDGGHYEQGLRWHGAVRAGEAQVEAAGLAVRDHSWGVRQLAGVTGVWWAPMVVTAETPSGKSTESVGNSLGVRAGGPGEALGAASEPTQLGGIKLMGGGQAVRMAFRRDGDGPIHASREFAVDLPDAGHAGRWESTRLHYGGPGDTGALDVTVEPLLRLPIAYPEGWGVPFVSDEMLGRVTLADGRSGFGIVEWNARGP